MHRRCLLASSLETVLSVFISHHWHHRHVRSAISIM